MSCPHCDSADVRPSRHALGLDRIGLHRYRCRACGGLFWLRRGRIEAVRARRRDYLEAPAGTSPPRPRTAPLPVTLGRLDAAPDALGALDQPAGAPAPATDLRALDLELARRRRETQPR
jgi:Zn-finger nucleic acid-binding protein